MPRLPRLSLPDIPQHVVQRGNDRRACFYSEDDQRRYLVYLEHALKKYRVSLHAYVLMTNHAHLLMTPSTEKGVACVMQSLGRRYVRYFNRRYERSGTLWEGRYYSCLVESERYLLACYRYIELNPVRARMVIEPGDYPWSSYHCNARGKEERLVTPHPVYQQLGSDNSARLQAYRDLFLSQPESDVLHAIRVATNTNRVLGSDRFREEMETRLSVRLRRRRTGRPRKRK